MPFTCCVHEWLKVCEGPSCTTCVRFFFAIVYCVVWWFFGGQTDHVRASGTDTFLSVVIASLRRCLFKITGQNKDQRFWSARVAEGGGLIS